MNFSALALAGAGCAIVLITWGVYLATIPRGTVPVRPVGSVVLQILGTALAIAGLVWGFSGGGSPGASVLVPAVFALMMGPGFLLILSQRKTPVGDITVRVGDRLRPFKTQTSEGERYDSEAFDGKRILLKFFRGHW